MTAWGAAISREDHPHAWTGDGRPAWLRGYGDPIAAKVRFDWYAPARIGPERDIRWDQVTAIKLPADHWAYAAIDKGYRPWAGGEHAPDEWDGKTVLWDDGEENDQLKPGDDGFYWTRTGGPNVIGYRRRQSEQSKPDGVFVPYLTEAEARVAFLARAPYETNEQNFVRCLRTLGLIRDETPLERFARETDTTVDDSNRAALQALLDWKDRQ